ncbi:MAG: hypothetical protein K9M96_05350, partial [Deltaproteobacteria bacterium]|nr:hypothetical protein [Deltaproteobacteria bacterium]
RALIESIGLEGERVGMVMESKDDPKPLAILARGIRERVFPLTPSPVLQGPTRSTEPAPREEKRV